MSSSLISSSCSFALSFLGTLPPKVVGRSTTTALQWLPVPAERIASASSFSAASSGAFAFSEVGGLAVVRPAAAAFTFSAFSLEAGRLADMSAPAALVSFVPLVQVLADVVLRPAPHVRVIFLEVDARIIVVLFGGVAVRLVVVVVRLTSVRVVLRRPRL